MNEDEVINYGRWELVTIFPTIGTKWWSISSQGKMIKTFGGNSGKNPEGKMLTCCVICEQKYVTSEVNKSIRRHEISGYLKQHVSQ